MSRTGWPAESGEASAARQHPLYCLQSLTVTGNKIAQDSVTNVQTAGVDEGIVKTQRSSVILRRGRLFTVSLRNRTNVGLRPVSHIDAFGPGLEGGTWIDEMLIHENTIIVIGYSYARGGTEVGLFDIARDGRILSRHYHLRSNDYFSPRATMRASSGWKLVFYTPLRLGYSHDAWSQLPAFRRWTGGASPAPIQTIAPATRIYRGGTTSPSRTRFARRNHRDLSRANELRIHRRARATGTRVLCLPRTRSMYGPDRAAFAWVLAAMRLENPPLFPHAARRRYHQLKTTGGQPVDQFSFLEDGNGHLNVFSANLRAR